MTVLSIEPRPRKMPPEWTIGERIRKIRREEGLTQAKFAARINIGERSLGAYETGIRTPPLKEAQKIARAIERAFGYPSQWVVMGDDRPDGPDTAPAPGLEPGTIRLTVTPISPALDYGIRRDLPLAA